MATIATAYWVQGQTDIITVKSVMPYSANWIWGKITLFGEILYPTGAIPTFVWPL